jgi:hypothetical protein
VVEGSPPGLDKKTLLNCHMSNHKSKAGLSLLSRIAVSLCKGRIGFESFLDL